MKVNILYLLGTVFSIYGIGVPLRIENSFNAWSLSVLFFFLAATSISFSRILKREADKIWIEKSFDLLPLKNLNEHDKRLHYFKFSKGEYTPEDRHICFIKKGENSFDRIVLEREEIENNSTWNIKPVVDAKVIIKCLEFKSSFMKYFATPPKYCKKHFIVPPDCGLQTVRPNIV